MNELGIIKENVIKHIDKHGISDVIKPLQEDIKLFDTFISDWLWIDDNDKKLFDVKEGDTLFMKLESRFDDAEYVALYSEAGGFVGGVRGFEKTIFANLMSAGKKLYAKVVERDAIRLGFNYLVYSIAIYMKDY